MGILLIGLFAPFIFWLFYYRYKDRFKPEPLKILGLTFLLGFISAYLCLNFLKLLIYWGVTTDVSAMIQTRDLRLFLHLFGVTGVVEEFFKLIPFIFVFRFLSDFDELIDSVIYSSIIALGFATFENLLYMKYLSGVELIGRGFASPLTHSVFASLWGYWFYRSADDKTGDFSKPVIAFIAAALFHGIYDFLSLDPKLRIFSAVLILLIWLWRIRLLETLHAKVSKRSGNN